MGFDHGQQRPGGRVAGQAVAAAVPGKRSLSETEEPAPEGGDVHAIAERGLAGAGRPLPRLDLVQRAFGKHDVSGVSAHVGGPAAEATAALDTQAYAFGNAIAFAREPDLFTVAHEAAHVVQQRGGVQLAGGIDSRDDAYEQHADQVASAVVRGDSAEALLDRGPAGGGPTGPAVQRDPNRDRVERSQVWDPAIDGPLSADDARTADADVAAIRENVALGLTGDKIRRLRAALGLAARPRMAHSIDRDVVRGIRRIQGGSGSGVLDEDTVFRLDLGATWTGRVGRGRYRRSDAWANLDRERFAEIRTAVVRALRVTEADLAQVGARPVVSERLIQQAVNWQFWHRCRDERIVWGLLEEAELAAMGVAIDVPAAAPPADASEAPAPAPGAADIEADTADAAAAEVDDEPAEGSLTPDSPAGQALVKIRRDMQDYRRARHRLRRDRMAQRALDAEMSPQIDAWHARAMRLGVNNERIYRASGAAPWMKARWTAEAITEAFGTPLPPLPSRRRGRTGSSAAAGAEPEGSAPALERSSTADAEAHLNESGVVVDRTAEGTLRRSELVRGAEGWEGRAIRGGRAGTVAPTEQVRDAAGDAVATMTPLRARIEHWRSRLDGALSAPTTLVATLDELHAELGRQPFADPATLRRPLRLTMPRALDPEQWSTPGRARATAFRWRSALRTASSQLERAIRTHRAYQGESIRRNPNAVRCDLSRTGVRVTNNGGRQLGPDEMHLDIAFADAMVRFLEMLRGLGATEMRTAGFLREPISPQDTHPWGRAADITGFKFGSVEIMLRNGRRDPAGYRAGTTRFSDWFNHDQRVNGRTYAQILQAITARMAQYFSAITGPGHDAAHDNHWHVELTGRDSDAPIRSVQDVAPEDASEDGAAG